jgi:hypothetical protein
MKKVLFALVLIVVGSALLWNFLERSRVRREMEAAFARFDAVCAERYQAVPELIRIADARREAKEGPAAITAALKLMSGFRPPDSNKGRLELAYEDWQQAGTAKGRTKAAAELDKEIEHFLRETDGEEQWRTNESLRQIRCTLASTHDALETASPGYAHAWSNYATNYVPGYGTFPPVWGLQLDGTYEVNPARLSPVSIATIRVSAELGVAAAQRDLALACLKGRLGLCTNQTEGLKWAEAAARQGDPVAEQIMGALYNYGSIVSQDVAQAAFWYRKAAEHGNPVGQVQLAGMLQRGRGGQTNAAEALDWLRRAAAQQWPEGARLLARAYWEGNGTPRNYAASYWWFRKAVKHGANDPDVRKFIHWIDTAIVCVLVVALFAGYRTVRWMFGATSHSLVAPSPIPAPASPSASIVGCPACGQKLRVQPEQLRATLRCRTCQNEFQVSTSERA